MRKSLLVASVIAAFSVLAGSASAALPDNHPAGDDGHDFSFTGSSDSKVTIDYKKKKKKFVGRLSSDFVDTEGVLDSAADEAAVCVASREVTVYRYRRNRSDRVVGSDSVGPGGRWSISKRRVHGRYYASASKSHTLLREYYGGIDYYVICRADSSRKIRL